MDISFRLVFGMCLLMGLLACTKDSESPISNLPETRAQLFGLLQTPYESATISGTDQQIVFPSGIFTQWTGQNVVDSLGQPVSGPFTLKVRGLIRPGDFIRNGSHTMGPDGILNTGGQLEFFLEKNGADLRHLVRFKNPLFVYLPADYPLARMQNLPAWEGENISLGRLDQAWYWKPGQELMVGNASLLISNRYYQSLRLRKPGLVQLGQVYNNPGEKQIQVEIKAPAGMGLSNALCYAWFPNLNSLLRFQGFDAQRAVFHSAGYPVPENASVVYLLLHFDGQAWKYSQIKTFTRAEPVSLPSPKTQSLNEILNQLNAL